MVNHAIRTALREVGCTSAYEPSLLNSERTALSTASTVNRASLRTWLFHVLKRLHARWLRGTFTERPPNLSSNRHAAGVQPCVCLVRLHLHSAPLVWEVFGLTHTKSASCADRRIKHAMVTRVLLLRDISGGLRQSSVRMWNSLRLSWFTSHSYKVPSAAMWSRVVYFFLRTLSAFLYSSTPK